jgi:two-component sensor histidine kinase
MPSFPSDLSLDDLIDTVRSALVVLDEDLRVKGANRSFYTLFEVQEADTVGRLIYDLGNRQWDIPALRELLERIVPRDEAIEGYEIDHDFEGIGRRTLTLNARRIQRPDLGVTSLLLAIDDVTAEREAARESERAWRLAQTIVDTVRDPLVILDGDMTVASANRAFLGLFSVTEAQVVGRKLKELGQGQWDVSALGVLLGKVVPDEAAFDGFEIEDEFPGLGRRIFKLNARKVFRSGNHVTRLLVVLEDVTEARLLERHRDILAAELAHRIKNSLQIITSFVSFEIRRASEPCVEGYRAMQTRIGAVAELYDVISRSAALGPVPVQPYLTGIAASLHSSLIGKAADIEILVEAEALLIDPDKAVSVGLIVNELATNAIKHAFPSGSGRIFLSFERYDDEVLLIVRDDGVGHDQARTSGAHSGLGARYVEAFVKQLGAALTQATGSSGTTTTVKLPGSIVVDPIAEPADGEPLLTP